MARPEILRPIPAVVGPTASGKTALSLALGARLGAEIISCDSMQIYRRMDIGTAKPSAAERAALPHHLLDIREIGEPYSAADYAADAADAVKDIEARGKVPLFCGGTGLYLSAARRGSSTAQDVPGETPLRRELLARANTPEGARALWEELQTVDPPSAAATHPNNLRRVIRALEIFYATGTPKSEWDRRTRETPPALPMVLFFLDWEREALYRRIDQRVDEMLAVGLMEEVRALFNEGLLSPGSTAGQAIGYKEFAACLRGEMSLSDATLALKTATRRYAKRQLTWFARETDRIRIAAQHADGTPRSPDELAEEILSYLPALSSHP